MNVDVPGRVFLDTCVVNFMLESGEQIHDCGFLPPVVTRETTDIEALRDLWVVGQRAMWQLAISPYTYSEIARTKVEEKLRQLHMWFQEIWKYWRFTIEKTYDLPNFIEAEDPCVRTLISDHLLFLPDVANRFLICDALKYRCNFFCTWD